MGDLLGTWASTEEEQEWLDREQFEEAQRAAYEDEERAREQEYLAAERQYYEDQAQAEHEHELAMEAEVLRRERIVFTLDQPTCPKCEAVAIGQVDVVPCINEFTVSDEGEVEGWTGNTVLEWDDQSETGAFMRKQAERLELETGADDDNANVIRSVYPASTVRVTCGAHEWESLISTDD